MGKRGPKKGFIPWNKGKKLSEITKNKMSKSHKGKILSEEIKRKISESKKGHVGYFKDKEFSEDHRINISRALKGRKLDPEHRKNLEYTYFKKGHIPYNKGKKRPELSGENHPLYGKHLSEEIKEKISKTHKGKTIPFHIRLKMGRKGEKNPAWRGGKSFEGYCETFYIKEFREFIFERDNFECQNPYCWKTNNVLTLHHIDYNKKNCIERNIILLCNSCNPRANKNRNYWKRLYKRIIKIKFYGG